MSTHDPHQRFRMSPPTGLSLQPSLVGGIRYYRGGAAVARPADAWPGHWARSAGGTPAGHTPHGAAHPPMGWPRAVGNPSPVMFPRRKLNGVLRIVLAIVLLPILLFGSCVAGVLVFGDDLMERGQTQQAQAVQTMVGCSPRGDVDACRQALGPEADLEAVAVVQGFIAALEREYGEFQTMELRGFCSHADPGGFARELRANVEWTEGSRALAFRWREVDGGWQLTTVALAQTVPRLCF